MKARKRRAIVALAAIQAVSGLGSASAADIGDWTYGRSNDRSSFYAFTTNDSGAVLGEWCNVSSGNCVWMIGLATMCDQDSSYPILANADTGAASIMISCGGKIAETNLSRYQFSNFKDVENLLKGAKRIGFAIPMQLDQFRVVRFSLTGAPEAVADMEQMAAKAYKPPKTDTKDTVL